MKSNIKKGDQGFSPNDTGRFGAAKSDQSYTPAPIPLSRHSSGMDLPAVDNVTSVQVVVRSPILNKKTKVHYMKHTLETIEQTSTEETQIHDDTPANKSIENKAAQAVSR